MLRKALETPLLHAEGFNRNFLITYCGSHYYILKEALYNMLMEGIIRNFVITY